MFFLYLYKFKISIVVFQLFRQVRIVWADVEKAEREKQRKLGIKSVPPKVNIHEKNVSTEGETNKKRSQEHSSEIKEDCDLLKDIKVELEDNFKEAVEGEDMECVAFKSGNVYPTSEETTKSEPMSTNPSAESDNMSTIAENPPGCSEGNSASTMATNEDKSMSTTLVTGPTGESENVLCETKCDESKEGTKE